MLEIELVESVVADAARLGYRRIQLTGGDPLISPTFLRAARAVHAAGVPILEVYTNGLGLRDELLDELVTLEAALAFSFYSSEPAIHDAITRTPGSSERTLRAIDRTVERGLPVRASIVVTASNAATVASTVEALEAHGVPEGAIAVIGEHSVGRGRYAEPTEPSSASERSAARAHATTAGDFAGKLAVASDGSVLPCIFARDLPLGNVRSASLHDIVTAKVPIAIDVERWLASNEALAPSLSCADCRLVRGALGRATLPLVAQAHPGYPGVRG